MVLPNLHDALSLDRLIRPAPLDSLEQGRELRNSQELAAP